MNYKRNLIACMVVLVLLFTGCAMLQPQIPQTPRDKSDLFMSFYMAQLRDYNARYLGSIQAGVVASAMEQDILKAKYEFLMNAWEPIAIYDSYITEGQVPPTVLEAQINGLINILENALKEGRE